MKPSNPALWNLLNGDALRAEQQERKRTDKEKALGMLERFEVIRNFHYQGMVRPKGAILWMKPHTASSYITAKLVKRYVEPVASREGNSSLFSSVEDQKELLSTLKEKAEALNADTITFDAPKGRDKYKSRDLR